MLFTPDLQKQAGTQKVRVNQVAHQFTEVGRPIYVKTDGDFALSIANSPASSDVIGVITSINSPDSFSYTPEPHILTSDIVLDGGAGATIYLSETVPGGFTLNEPDISKPLGTIIESGAKMTMQTFRGMRGTESSPGEGTGNGTVTGVTLETGVSFHDIANKALYNVYGVEDAWEATQYTDTERSTGVQVGEVPTTLTELQALTYI